MPLWHSHPLLFCLRRPICTDRDRNVVPFLVKFLRNLVQGLCYHFLKLLLRIFQGRRGLLSRVTQQPIQCARPRFLPAVILEPLLRTPVPPPEKSEEESQHQRD